MSPPAVLFCGDPDRHDIHWYTKDHGSSGVYRHLCWGYVRPVPVGPTREDTKA